MAWGAKRSNPLPAGWGRIRRRVLRASDTCYLCGKSGSDEVDHIKPRYEGGSDEESNLAPVHKSCHLKKSSAEGNARSAELRRRRVRPEGRHPGAM